MFLSLPPFRCRRSGSSQFARRTVAGTTRESILSEPKHSTSLDSFRPNEYRSLDRNDWANHSSRPSTNPTAAFSASNQNPAPLAANHRGEYAPNRLIGRPLSPPNHGRPLSTATNAIGRPLSPANQNLGRPLSPANQNSSRPLSPANQGRPLSPTTNGGTGVR